MAHLRGRPPAQLPEPEPERPLDPEAPPYPWDPEGYDPKAERPDPDEDLVELTMEEIVAGALAERLGLSPRDPNAPPPSPLPEFLRTMREL